MFEDAATAAKCAVEMQRAIAELSPESLGLPESFGLRLAGHYGPVYPSRDTILKERNFFGAHVSRAARLEPVTAVNEIYITEPFAAMLALDPRGAFSCDYVGSHPAAKDYGDLPMFSLRPRSS